MCGDRPAMGSPMAKAKRSGSCGQIGLEPMAQVLVKFFADSANFLQHAARIDVDRSRMFQIQVSGDVLAGTRTQHALFEACPGLAGSARTVFKACSTNFRRWMSANPLAISRLSEGVA